MIDFLNWPDIAGLPRVIHLILAAVVVLAGRHLWNEWRTERRYY